MTIQSDPDGPPFRDGGRFHLRLAQSQTDIDGEIDFYQKATYDNLDRVTKSERFDTTANGNLVARSETKYDDRGRVYQNIRYGVDPSTGTVGNSLTDNTWYDAAGNVITRISHGNPKLRHNLHQQMVLRPSCPDRRALKPDAQASGRDEFLAGLGGNRYTYAFGSGVKMTDPRGRLTIVELIVIGIIVIVIITVLTWAGCQFSRAVRSTVKTKTTCRRNRKFVDATALLQQCGFGGDSNWAEANDGINAWCTETPADEAVTVFPAPATSSGMSTTLGVHYLFDAADVAMQIAGEFYRQNSSIVVDIDNQTMRLNRLIDCRYNLNEIPTRHWRHEGEDPGLIDPRR